MIRSLAKHSGQFIILSAWQTQQLTIFQAAIAAELLSCRLDEWQQRGSKAEWQYECSNRELGVGRRCWLADVCAGRLPAPPSTFVSQICKCVLTAVMCWVLRCLRDMHTYVNMYVDGATYLFICMYVCVTRFCMHICIYIFFLWPSCVNADKVWQIKKRLLNILSGLSPAVGPHATKRTWTVIVCERVWVRVCASM